MERRKFTREYKLEAVRLIKDRGVSYVRASQDLGVHTSQLRDWVKKFADDPEHAFPGIRSVSVYPSRAATTRMRRHPHFSHFRAHASQRRRARFDSAGVERHSGLDQLILLRPATANRIIIRSSRRQAKHNFSQREIC
jgi:transposase-like protein